MLANKLCCSGAGVIISFSFLSNLFLHYKLSFPQISTYKIA